MVSINNGGVLNPNWDIQLYKYAGFKSWNCEKCAEYIGVYLGCFSIKKNTKSNFPFFEQLLYIYLFESLWVMNYDYRVQNLHYFSFFVNSIYCYKYKL